MSRPTMILVPGAWHKSDIYAKTMSRLQQHEYGTIGLDLPSAGAKPPHTSFDGDVKGIRDCLTKAIVSEGKEVILVTHSYTGMPGAEATKGLGKTEREKQGLRGGIVRLVFVAAFAMPEGFRPTASGHGFPDWMRMDAENGIVTVAPEDAKRIFYHDIPSSEADEWAAKLVQQSIGVYDSTQTYAGWRYIPSTYVIGSEDRTFFTPEVVEMIIGGARQIEPSAFDVVETCGRAGHCLMISHPDWLADVLRRAAGETC